MSARCKRPPVTQAVLTDYFKEGKRGALSHPATKLRKVDVPEEETTKFQSLITPIPEKLCMDGCGSMNEPLTARKRKHATPKEYAPSPARSTKRNLNFDQDCLSAVVECDNVSPAKQLIEVPHATGAPVKRGQHIKPVKNVAALQKRLAEFSETAKRLNIRKKELTPSPSKIEPAVPLKVNTPEKVVHPSFRQSEPSKFADQIRKDLPLPNCHQTLFDTFRGTETVASILYNRDELVTFEKIKNPVQQITKRNFLKKNLAQIKQVYPEAYAISLRKLVSKPGERVKPGSYDLGISPNLNSDLVTYTCRTPMKSPVKPGLSLSLPKSPLKMEGGAGKDEQKRKFTGEHQNMRRHVFRANLMKHVHRYHKIFLETLATPIKWSEGDMAKCVRWHPAFKLESVPEIVEASLPCPPKVDGIISAKRFLLEDGGKMDKKIEIAVAIVAAKNEDQLENIIETETPKIQKIESNKKEGKLKGVNPKLLEMIRAKEAAKKKADLLRDPVKELREKRLNRLPDLYRIIRTYFTTVGGNKTTLPLDKIIKKLTESCAFCRDKTEMICHVELLFEVGPEFVTQQTLRGVSYMKLDTSHKIGEILQKLKDIEK